MKRQPAIKALIATLLLWAAAVAYAEQPVAVIENLHQPFDLNSFIETIEDPNHEYSLTDILAGNYDHLWQKNNSRQFVGYHIKSKYWFRIKFNWQGESEVSSILRLNSHPVLLNRLGLVLPSSDTIIRTGVLEPKTPTALPSGHYAFPLALKPGQPQTIVGWANNNEGALPIQLPFSLHSVGDFAAVDRTIYGILVAFYASMGALLLYNACLFVTLRHPVYGLYLLFLMGAVLSCACVDGTADRWLWPDTPMIKFRIAIANGILTTMAYLAFIVVALGGVRHWPNFLRLIQWLLGLGVACVIYVMLTNDLALANGINQLYTTLLMPVAIITILRAWLNRMPTAGYLLTAELMIVLGGSGFMLMAQGVAPTNNLTMWSLHGGFAAEALLLSLALAARTRLAQQAAIENLQKYQTIYNDSIEGLFHYDFQTKSLQCNNALAQLFGYQTAHELSPASDALSQFFPDVQAALSNILHAAGSVKDYEVEIINPQTTAKTWISITMRLVRDRSGKPLGIEGSMIDISERKLKENLQREKEIEQGKNQAKSQFFASMSHELRTPLTAILGYSEVALDESLEKAEIQQHVKTIARGGKHLLKLVNDILDLSKIEAQKLEVESLLVPIIDLISDVKDYFLVMASQKGIGFSVDFQLPLPSVILTDPTRLKQTLINLCGNAIKFTEQGAVTLAVSCDQQRQTLRFAVIDTGIGLRSEQLNKLFGAFSQANASTTRNFGGTGLGLYLSKRIAEKLGGDISVQSEYGKGSTFTLELPFGPLQGIEWISTLSPEEIQGCGSVEVPRLVGHLLYAEDNPQNQELVATFVEQTGCTIDVVSNGQTALDLGKVKNYDLIFTDIRMPSVDGVELAVNLLKAKPQLPIIAITAMATDEEVAEFNAAGFKQILRKPIDRKMLYAAMSTYLPKRISNGSEKPRNQSRPLRVLLAEDNLDNQALIKLHLKRMGCDTTCVKDGGEAIAKAQSEVFDLILMDMQMPNMDGMTATKYLRSRAFDKPIYALTANQSADAMQLSLDAGCDGHLTKPLDLASLSALIQGIAQQIR